MAKWVVPPNSNAVTWCLVGVGQRWPPSQRQCKASCVHVGPMQTHKPPQTWPTMLPPQQPTRLGACKGPRSKVGGTMAKVGNVLPMWAGPKPILVAGVGSRGQGCHQTQMQPPQVARSWHHSGACLGLWGPCWVPWLRNRQPLVGFGCPQATIDHATSKGCQATVSMALGVRWRFGAAPHGWAMLGWRLRGVCVVLGAAVGKARPFAHQRCPFAR